MDSLIQMQPLGSYQGVKGPRVGDDMKSLRQTQPKMCEMMNDGDSWSSKQSGGVQRLLVPKLAGAGGDLNINDTAVTKFHMCTLSKLGNYIERETASQTEAEILSSSHSALAVTVIWRVLVVTITW